MPRFNCFTGFTRCHLGGRVVKYCQNSLTFEREGIIFSICGPRTAVDGTRGDR